MEKGSVVKMMSLYLKFFEMDPDGKSRSCKFCNVTYPLTTALGNLGRHLKYFHPEYDKMGDVISSLLPQPITMISVRTDKVGDDTARPSPQPIRAGTETANKTGGAIPSWSLRPIPTVSKSADKMGDAVYSPSPQSITTVSNMVQSEVEHSSIVNLDNVTCKNVEPKSMTAKGTVSEVAAVYLKFFETAPDGKSRRCKFCSQSYPIAIAYGNLGRHLKYRHPEYDKIGDVVSSPSPQRIATVTEIAAKKGEAVPRLSPQTITTVSKSPDKLGDAISSLSPQSTAPVSKRVQSQVKQIVTVTEVASLYLKFFETASDGKSRSCKFCNQSYPIATAYGNLGRHLKYRHPEYDKMGDAVSSPSPQHIATVSERINKMGDVLSTPSPQHITTVSGRADKMGDAIPSPSPLPITTVTEIAEKKGDAVPRLSPQPNTSVPKMAHRGNVIPAERPTKISLSSLFETSPDGKSQSCKLCNQSYSISTAIGNLQRHLKHRHPGEYDKMCDVISNSSPVQLITTASKSSTVDLDHVNWLLLRWLMGSPYPPSALQDKWLLNSFQFVNPMVRIWSNERLQAVILEVFRSMQEDVKASLNFVNSKISLTLDFWTSCEQIFYMSITGHWIDESWSRHKVLLDVSRIPYPCSGTDIYRTFMKVLKMYNIGNRILSCTHDNSQTAIHACHALKDFLDSRNSMAFCYIPCAARTLNLIIEDGLRTAKPLISRIRELVLELNTSPVIASDFKQTTSVYQEGSWNFPIDISTRWSGKYAMLDIARKVIFRVHYVYCDIIVIFVCILLFRERILFLSTNLISVITLQASKSIDAVIRKHEGSLASNYMLLNPEEKVAVSIMHLYLEPFHKTTNNICTSKFPTVGLVLFFMVDVFEMIAACRGSWHAPDWLKCCAEDMAEKGRIYNDQVHNIYTFMAAILDPRIKGELIPESFKLESNLREARDYFMRHYSNTHFPTPANGYSPQGNVHEGSVTSSEEVNWKRRRVDMSTPTDELGQYLSEAPSPITTDILDWWKANSSKYPQLSVMARDFLAVQSTSVLPEELFSGKGDEVDNQRFCLPYASTQPVLCMRAWIESGFKLKYRSAEIDFEKLMAAAMRAW
ncbi:hypothetical protein MKW94_020794 [Papaver nudicaule]|uniref:Uncharacterized protein n=1 Tax=Papaver nudicaule TaxID=74823 RepID=A0AA41VZ86_PAPNU|nr:hypothetical protein [Papaver nudicaule]